MLQVLFEGNLFADYFQITLREEARPTLPNDYSAATIARRLMVGPHGVIVHTARNMTVPVRVTWLEERPAVDHDAFQHVVEAGFASPTGLLVLAGLTDNVAEAPRLTVPAGPLGVRACFAGLDTLDEAELDGDDRYLLQLWPGPEPEGARVLRAWPEA